MNAETGITMGNKGKKTEEKRRNYWIIGLVLASSAILLYILIYLSFAGNGFIPTGEYLTKGDWLAFFGTYLSFVAMEKGKLQRRSDWQCGQRGME